MARYTPPDCFVFYKEGGKYVSPSSSEQTAEQSEEVAQSRKLHRRSRRQRGDQSPDKPADGRRLALCGGRRRVGSGLSCYKFEK